MTVALVVGICPTLSQFLESKLCTLHLSAKRADSVLCCLDTGQLLLVMADRPLAYIFNHYSNFIVQQRETIAQDIKKLRLCRFELISRLITNNYTRGVTVSIDLSVWEH